MMSLAEVGTRPLRAELAILRDDRCQITPVSLSLPDDLPEERYQEIANALLRMGRGTQWWIGDVLAYGERRFGATYRALLDSTGYAVQTLDNMASVARRVDFSRRRENLSWSHHERVASLPAQEQEEWLYQAAFNQWSVRRLDEMMDEAGAKATEPPSAEPDPKDTAAAERVQEWMEAPNALPELLDAPPAEGAPARIAELDAPPAAEEVATPVDYATALALGRSLSQNALKGEIGPPILIEGKLWVVGKVTLDTGTGRQQMECYRVMEMDFWIERGAENNPKLVHYTERDEAVASGKREPSDVAGLKVVWVSAPRDTTCYYVPTGETRTFVYTPKGAGKGEEKRSEPPPTHTTEEAEEAVARLATERGMTRNEAASALTAPVATPIVAEPMHVSSNPTDPPAQFVVDLEDLHTQLTAFLYASPGILSPLAPEEPLTMSPAEFVAYWQEFLEKATGAIAYEREMSRLLQSKLNAERESRAGDGLYISGADYKLLCALASRKRPGDTEVVSPANYLTMILEQRAAMAGIKVEEAVGS
jgi:hypothetical protein